MTINTFKLQDNLHRYEFINEINKGWAVEKIGLPKATGQSYWVRLKYNRDKDIEREIISTSNIL